MERAGAYQDHRYLELKARLATRLRRLRKQRGWTQAEAAERCGLSREQWSHLEAAALNPTFVTLCKLAAGLGVDAARLISPIKVDPKLLDPDRRGRLDKVP